MELLYVWIKDFKNIKEQGFNFSPKWRFHYDPVTGKLDVEDRRDKVIENFFGEHISNVTAIVGENGSGKSNLLEFVMEKLHFLTGFWDEPFILIISHEGILKAWKFADLKIYNNSVLVRDFKMINNEDWGKGGISGNNEFDEIQCVYYTNFFKDKHIFENEGRNYHFYDESTDGIIHRLRKANQERKKNETIAISYFNFELQKQIKFIGEGGNNIVKLKLPHYLKISPNYNAKRVQMLLEFENKLYTNVSESITYIENYFNKKGFGDKLYSYLLLPALYEACSTRTTGEDFVLGIKRKIHENKSFTYHDLNNIESIGMVTHSEIIKFVEWAEKNLNTYYDTSRNEFLIPLNEKSAFEFIDKIRYINYQFAQPFKYSWHFEDFDENISLSSGETSLLGFFSRLYSLKGRLLVTQPIFLFIDEGELSYHPTWQKQLLKLLFESLPKLWGFDNDQRMEIQIIFTTHSSFLLSDLPKENIIFLKKGKDGNCKVVDGLDDMKQTFGANIHTLLSDSFFMDGLMGDFAKGKIDMVIRYLNNEPSNGEQMTEDEADRIINMIGEPILKRHLQQQFQYKKQNREMKELKRRIAALENEKTTPND